MLSSVMSRIDLVSKNLVANFFSQLSQKKIIEKKLCQKINYKYRKNRKNNKSNKNQDLEKKEAKKDPELSAKVTRIFLAS